MFSQGPRTPGSASSDNSNGGTAPWIPSGGTLVSAISVSGGSSAIAEVEGDESSTYLKVQNFSFSIPNNAIIRGIVLSLRKLKGDGVPSGPVIDQDVFLVKNNVIVGSDRSAGTWPTGSFSTQNYGGSFDLWGTTWTPADINASNFGFVIAAQGTDPSSGLNQAAIDLVELTVFYDFVSDLGHVF